MVYLYKEITMTEKKTGVEATVRDKYFRQYPWERIPKKSQDSSLM
jgi:hypothetical protein